MAETNDNIRKLHQALKSQGYNDIGSEDEFRAFVSNNDNVKRLHQSLKDAGFNDLGSEDEFGQWLSTSAAPSVPAGDAAGTAASGDVPAPSQQTEQAPVENAPTFEVGGDSKVVEFDHFKAENAPTFEVGGNGYTFTEDELQKMEEGQRPVMKPKYGTPEYGNQKIEGDASNPYAGMTRQQAINAVGKKFFNEWYGKDHTPETTQEVDGEQVKYGGLGAYDQIRAELAANNIVDPENYANVTKDIRRAYIPEVARRRIQQLMGGFDSANHWNAEEIRNVLDSREAQQAINADLERLGFAPTPEAYDGDQEAMHRDIQRYEQARQYYYKQLENELENVLVDKYGWLPSKDGRSRVESFRDELLSGGAAEHEKRILGRELGREYEPIVGKHYEDAVLKGFEDAEKRAEEAYERNMAGSAHDSNSALASELSARRQANKQRDPDKILESILKNVQSPALLMTENPELFEKVWADAAAKGIDINEYIDQYLVPSIESGVVKRFEQEAARRELPKDTFGYILNGLRESLPGMLLTSYTDTDSQRRFQQMADQMTAEGKNPYYNPGVVASIGRGVASMLPDLPLFGLYGKMAAPMIGRATQTLMTRGWRPLFTRMAGSSLGGITTMGGVEATKGGLEGYLYGDRSLPGGVFGDVFTGAVQRGVPGALMGSAMVGGPIANKLLNGGGIVRNIANWVTQTGIDATGATGLSVVTGEVKPEDAGSHFLENLGTFAALGAQHRLGSLNKRQWNGVTLDRKNIRELEDYGLGKFNSLMKEMERAQNKGGLIGQSLGLESTKKQIEAAKSEGAKFYNDLMRSYSVSRDTKVKVAQALGTPLPDYVLNPSILQLWNEVPGKIVDLGFVDMMEYDFNGRGGVAEKTARGENLTKEELDLRLLFQDNKLFNDMMTRLQAGEQLSPEEMDFVNTYQRRLVQMRNAYIGRERERLIQEFEGEHKLEPGTLTQMLRDVNEGKAVDQNVLGDIERVLRDYKTRAEEAEEAVNSSRDEKESAIEAEKPAVENTENQVGGVPENESINKAEVVTENETTPPPPLVMDEKGEVVWEQSPVEATIAGLTERVGQERVGQIVDEFLAMFTDKLTSLSERRVENVNEYLKREQDIADVAEHMVYWQQVKDAITPKEEVAKPEEAAPETPVVEAEAQKPAESEAPVVEQKPEEQKPAEAETPVEGEAPAAPEQPVTPPEDAERPAELTAEQKVAQGTVNNNTGKRFGFQNQDGTRSEVVIDGIGEDGKVEVTRQDYDADGRETGDPYKQSLDMVKVGNSIVNGVMKPALTTEEKLRKVHKFDKFKVGDVPLIDVLTDAEQRQVLEALERGDTEAVGNMTPDLIKAHHEDLILKGRDDRNAKVRSIMEGNGSREQKLRKVRELYKGYDDAEVSLEDATLAPTTLEEYVADLHSRVPKSGEGPIAYFSYKQGDTEVTGLQDESGYGKKSSGDADAFKPWLAPKGKGMSLMKYAEQIHSQLPEEIQKQFDVNDVRNAILDVFSAAERPSDITTMILKRGVEQAEQAVRRMEDDAISRPGYQKVSADDNSFAGRLTRAKEQTNADPTEKQKEAGNYKKGHVSFGGYDFVVENPEGSMRRGKDADGKSWEQKMNNTYGYILGKRGKDGDHLDMFINDAQDLDNWNGKVYVVDQVNPKTGEFDEHKILYGFDSEEAARDAYLSNYEEGWQGLGKITGVDKDTFDKWLDSSDRKIKAFAEHSIPREAVEKEEKQAVTDAEIDKAFVTELDKEMKNAGVKVADTLEEVKDGQAILDAVNGEAKLSKSETNSPVFVSNAMKAVEGIKQEKATPEQWLAMITKAGGLKAGEDKWMGLSDWLKEQKGSVTKQEVMDFIRENQIEIEEETYTENPQGFEELKREYEQWLHNEGYDYAWEQLRERFGDDAEIAFGDMGGELTIDNGDAASVLLGSEKPINSTRLDYTTNGLTNKREIALVVPTVESWNESDEVHFGDAGEGRAVAWVRFGDAYVPNMGGDPNDLASGVSKVLVIDEIQSKRHQEGREKGYKTKESVEEEERLGEAVNKAQDAYDAYTRKMGEKYDGAYEDIYSEMTDAEQAEADRLEQEVYSASEKLQNHNISDIPDAPFDKNWHELAMKRMLRYAAENGYDKVAWTKGEQQAKRYNIGNFVEDLFYKKNEDGTYTVSVNTKDVRGHGAGRYNDYAVKTYPNQSETDLINLLGKDVAQKIIDGKGQKGFTHNGEKGWTTFKGKDLYVGGEGMKGFYDQILPRFMDKYGKKWSVKTGEVELPNVEKAGRKMWSVDVTPEMKESVMQGQPMFFKTPDGHAYGFTYKGKIYIDPRIATAETPIHEYGHLWAEMKRQTSPKEWDAIKEALLNDKVVDPFIEKVKREYPELLGEGREDDFIEEVLTQFSGKHGAEKLHRMAEEIKAELGGDATAETIAQAAIRRVKSVLNDFWKSICDMMGWKYTNAEDVADTILRDMLNGVNPMEKMKDVPKDVKSQKEIEREKPFHDMIDELFTNPEFDKTAHSRVHYDLGDTPEYMKKLGIKGERFTLQFKNIKTHVGKDADHNLTAKEWHELPEAIKKPFLITTYGDGDGKYRLYTTIKVGNKYAVVGVDVVKINQGKDAPMLDLNRIKTVFGRDRYVMENGEKILAYDENITPEQEALLRGHNFREYPSIQELSSAGKGTKNIDTLQINGEKNEENLLREGDAIIIPLSRKKLTPKEQKAREAFAERQWRRAHERAAESIEKLNLTDNVTVVDSVDELPDADKISARQRRAKGWYDPDTGKIVIVMGNHRSPDDVVRTVLHEGVAHHGLRKLFGKNFDQFLTNAYGSATKEISEEIDKLAEGKYDGDKNKATEEYLAKLAEETDFEDAEKKSWVHHWFNQVKEAFLDMLSKLGLPGMEKKEFLSDNELRYILWRSYKNLSEPGRYKNVFGGEMAKKLGVGEPARVVRMGHIEDEIPLTLFNHKDEIAIRERVQKMSLAEAEKAYKRINDKMLDENGLDLDEHFEKVKQDWLAAHGLNGIGKAMSDALQTAMDKYGSGMVELRWALLDRIEELKASESTPLLRDGEEETDGKDAVDRMLDEVERRKSMPKYQKVGNSEPFKLSEEQKDSEGNSFYERKGSVDLWNISPLFAKARRQDAPIRLTDRNANHIMTSHGNVFKSEQDVFDFLDGVFANATKLRRGRGRGMFVVVENDITDQAAIIKLMPSETGDYYNVESAGFYRKSKWKDTEDVIAELSEPAQSDAATDASKPQVPDENGGELINAEAQVSSSVGKGKKNNDTLQINGEENAEKNNGKDAVDRMLDEVERRKSMPKYQRVEGGPEPELTPEERQYWKKYEDDLKKWKARNGLKEDAQEPMAVPRKNADESATDYAKRVMEYAREKAKWKTAPRVEDYRQRRLDKDMVDAAREEEKRYPDSQSAKMRRAAAEFQQIRTRIGQQKAYDKATVKAVTDFAQDFMRMGFGDNLTKGEISRLLSSVKNATGASSVKKEVDNIMNVLMDSYLRDLENRLVKLSSVKELNQTAQGVEKQGKLELKGQRMIQAFREARQGRWDAKTLRERLEKIDEDIDKDPEGADMYEQEREGVEIALQYVENIEESRQEWERLNKEYKDFEHNYKSSGRTHQEQQQLLESQERAMQENKMERIAMYGGIMGRLQGNIEESIVGAKEFREREREHTKMIHAIANFDTAGMDMGAFRSSKDEKGRRAGLFFSPLGTFEQMLKQFGSRNAKGEGYLYDYFLRNWMDSTNRAYEGEEQAKTELDEKAQAVFGDEKVKRWSDIYKLVQNEKKMPGMEVEVIDQGERKQLHLTQGNMLYIYMANKMNDGAMKLRKMGITEEDVAKIKENLDERLVELGDWLQDEYLPAKRVKYNQVHERMFGAPMAAIDHYFPIKVLGDARQQDVDMNEAFNKNALPSTITGSIIKRKKNTLPLDILHTDALSLAIEHIEDMEQWAAMAEWKKDISTLLSYTTFRNKVKNMKTIYGSGNELWRNFFDAATIAAGEYQPKRGDADKAVTNIAKGVTSAKINFRLYTAFKQILSAPAFAHDVRLDDFIKNSFNPYGSWKWAMENMPVFRKRVNSRKAGDTRLEDTDEDWKLWKSNFMKLATRYGMSANAFVDAVTCAVGARSIYETRYRKYLKMGADEEKAHQRAMQDAMIGYNLTQQSSEGAFVSKIQKDRTVAANMLSVFRNGPMAYGRQEYDAYRNLKRMLKASSEEKEDRINFMARQLEEGLGLNSEQAQEAARKQYNRAMWHELGKLMNMALGVTVAWNLGASLPYLLMGDDWETKMEMLKDALLKGIAGPVEGFAGGNLISDMVGLATNKQVRNAFGESFEEGVNKMRNSVSTYEINPLPLLADLDKLLQHAGGDVYALANDLFNIWAQSNLGFNPQTFTDFWNACVDYGFVDNIPLIGAGVDPSLHNKKGLGNAREIALFLMRVANAPTSSWKNKLIDELGADIKIDEAKRMTYNELASRYANYKGWKDAPLTGFLRSDESREKMLKKKEEQFKKAVQERLDNLSNEQVVDLDINRQDDAGLHEAAKKQIDKRAEKMSEEELKYLFDNVFLIDERKTVGKEMARRLGFDGEKDENGKEIVPSPSNADYFMVNCNKGDDEKEVESKNNYVKNRTWNDIVEDLQLEVIKRDAKAAGDNATAAAVDAAKKSMMGYIKQIGNNATTLWDGTVNDEEYRWNKIREIRSKVLEKYGKKKDRKSFLGVSLGEQQQE